MFAIINKRTRKFVYGTDYRYKRITPNNKRLHNQITSHEKALTYDEKHRAINDLTVRGCGKEYEVVEVELIVKDRK